MSLIYRVFHNFISYIGNFIFVVYRYSIPRRLVSYRTLAAAIFSLVRVAVAGYSYVQHRSLFVAKHVGQTSAARPA